MALQRPLARDGDDKKGAQQPAAGSGLGEEEDGGCLPSKDAIPLWPEGQVPLVL